MLPPNATDIFIILLSVVIEHPIKTHGQRVPPSPAKSPQKAISKSSKRKDVSHKMKNPYTYRCIPKPRSTTKAGDRALVAFDKVYKKAMAGEADPDGFLRAALKWGSSPAALGSPHPEQNPMDVARLKVKALLEKSATRSQSEDKVHKLVHSLLHNGQ